MAESLADRLLFVMKAKGWTPYEWSQKSGLSDSTVANIITRGTNARTATLSALAVSASVSFDWLALGKGISGLDDAQEHPPDDIDAAGRRPIAQDATRTSRPVFENLPDWADLLAGARAMQAERGREIPDWAFTAVATSSALLTAPPSAATIYDLARVYADHGIGKPRPPRAETGVVAKVKTEGG